MNTQPSPANDHGAAHDRSTLSAGERRTLDEIFQHPLSHNLEWRHVTALLGVIGDAEQKNGDEFAFTVNGERLLIRKPHGKDLPVTEVLSVRHFLERAGWSSKGPSVATGDGAQAETAFVVVADHAGATIHRIEVSLEGPTGRARDAEPPQRIAHHIEREHSDEDREEHYPDDMAFFEAVALAVAKGGPIVVIGHGKGQSNEADHLSAYLQAHHKDIHDRIVGELIADLSHMSEGELLDLGRHALPDPG